MKRFWRDKQGNYGLFGAILSLPLVLSVGFAVDYSRYLAAKSHLQELVDAAALALAVSKETDETKLKAIARDSINSNKDAGRIDHVEIARLKTGKDDVDLALTGDLPTIFMGIVNYDRLPVRASAEAQRAVTGTVEVALVLDNTWSMSEADAKGVSKIGTLKLAANSLVTQLMDTDGAVVKIGLVPYADYVNVGTGYRNAAWLSIPAEYTTAAVPKTCEKKEVTTTPCTQNAPKYACTKYTDGVPYQATCGGECTAWGTPYTETKDVCTGGSAEKSYKWFGCVGSRKTGTTRLNDGSLSVTYPGYLDTTQKCLNPIVPLTNDKSALKAAINSMIINIGTYQPYTYIPAGLIWGLNILSPTEPFAQGAAYDMAKNNEPRKVVVLMTDGDNTLRFQSSDGKHVSLSTNAATALTQVTQTNNDTASICANIKANKIEIFTVAFMVDNDVAKNLLKSCASDAEHYYDASDPDKLLAAFSGIAQSLRVVRLAR